MAEPAGDGLTCDGFLGGRLRILQPGAGYRAGIDPVLLAAATPARAGERVLDLGCGVGTAALCLGARVPGLRLTGIERQPDYAALARRNAAENAIAFEVHEGDLADPPDALRSESFDHVILNPPYWNPARRSAAADPGREAALAGETPLGVWFDTALRRLGPGGRLTAIAAAEQVPALFAALDARAGGVVLHPLHPRVGRPAGRVILRARKGARAPFRLAPPTMLHTGTAHARDGDDYAPEIAAILRSGAPFPWT